MASRVEDAAVGSSPGRTVERLMTDEVLVSVQGVSKKFCSELRRSLRYAAVDVARDLLRPIRKATSRKRDGLRPGEFWALRDVSFDLHRGESVGIMGINGAGKSTLLKIVLGSLRLTGGRTITRGRLTALTEHGLGFDPVLTGRENAYMSAAVLGIDRRRVDEALEDIVAFAELEQFIDSPVRFYSTGMRARLGFAVAMHLEPDVLLVDEVLAVGDIGFQRRCIEHAKRYLDAGGSLILVSHNPLLVQTMCDRCLVLDRGALLLDGDVVRGVQRYCEVVSAASEGHPPDPVLLDPTGVSGLGGTAPISAFSDLEQDSDALVVVEDFGIRPIDSERLLTSEPARIFVRYRSKKDLQVRWGFCLLTADLTTTIACEGRLKPIQLRAGGGELSGRMNSLPLCAGHYTLRVAIMDPETDRPFATRGYRDTPHHFAVEMTTSRRNNYRMFAKDLIALDGLEWEEIIYNDDAGRAG